jgi:hypothetical protein
MTRICQCVLRTTRSYMCRTWRLRVSSCSKVLSPFCSIASEWMRFVWGIVLIVYSNVDILSAVLNSWASLVRYRPLLVNLVVSTLSSWTPAALAGQPAYNVKSVEKAVRILLLHISRSVPYFIRIASLLNWVQRSKWQPTRWANP